MRVHVHTRFCFFCVLTLLFHQCTHCHGSAHHHHHSNGHEHDHDHVHNERQIPREFFLDPVDHTDTLIVSGSQSEAAKQEQQFYIKKLFHRYGKQDQLDFRGFESLLLSLGLGEVRVVELEHDDLGHDHVAHLDLLEVQEGRHSHSVGHLHPHEEHSYHDHHHHSHANAEASSCCPKITNEGDLHKQDDHDHQEHKQINTKRVDHDLDHTLNHEHSGDPNHNRLRQSDNSSPEIHNHGHQQNHSHTSDHEQRAHDHAHKNNHGQYQNTGLSQDHIFTHKHNRQLTKTQTHHHNHKQSHPHNHHPTIQNNPTQASPLTDTLQPLTPSQSPSPMPKTARKPLKGPILHSQSKKLNTLDWNVSSGVDDNGNEQEHDDHMHSYSESQKRKREVSSLTGHFEEMSAVHEECLNLTQLLNHYGLSPDSLISPAQFTYLCPALLYQIDSRVCIRHYHQVDIKEATELSGWIWAWGFLSITVISLLSLLGVVLVPILNQSFFKFLLTFLVALAVGTLSGDALLHLLPHSQGVHDHSHSEHKADENEVDYLTQFDAVWKGLTALAGIYLLFIIEHCIRMVKHYKDQGGKFCWRRKKNEDGNIGRKLSDHKLNRNSDAEWMHLKRLDDSSHSDTQMTELQPPDSPSKTSLAIAHVEHSVAVEENGKKIKKHGHSHQGHCHSAKDMENAGIASIAWMVIMGDGMHNFSDGLAIGAAFSANITGGISTSVAVFCHELPHELGDFAVLLKAGMTVKQATVYNLLSALMAYFGMVIGTAVGQYTHNVTSWIFAITAGMFLYVALVDMLPEMLHGDSEDHKSCQLGHFVLQNVGLLTGFGIMLLIAIFEDNIVLDFGF